MVLSLRPAPSEKRCRYGTPGSTAPGDPAVWGRWRGWGTERPYPCSDPPLSAVAAQVSQLKPPLRGQEQGRERPQGRNKHFREALPRPPTQVRLPLTLRERTALAPESTCADVWARTRVTVQCQAPREAGPHEGQATTASFPTTSSAQQVFIDYRSQKRQHFTTGYWKQGSTLLLAGPLGAATRVHTIMQSIDYTNLQGSRFPLSSHFAFLKR